MSKKTFHGKSSANTSVIASKVISGGYSKDVKKLAASALTQISGKQGVSSKTASSAAKILKNKTASKDAKTVAASALTQWPAREPAQVRAKKIRKAVEKHLSEK